MAIKAMTIFQVFKFVNLLFLFLLRVDGSTEILRPRGVSLSKKIFYDPSKDFTCLDGSETVPFKFVNDDYCDCEDGSDEPGTAACPNAFFHCTNAGHKPKEIPTSWVNDGICDCCDTSDEYNSSSDCVNNCIELGIRAREESARKKELLVKGSNLRLELGKQGIQKKQEYKVYLEKLRKEYEESLRIKDEKEEIKKEAEEKEKVALEKYKVEEDDKKHQQEELDVLRQQEEEKVNAENAFNTLDKNEDGILTVDELQQCLKFDQNRDGVVSKEEAMIFLQMKEEMEYDEFISTGWMIMKPIYMMDVTSIPETPVVHSSAEEMASKDDYLIQEVNEHEEPVEGDNSENVQKEEEKPSEKEEPKYDEETQNIVDAANQAREEFSKAEKEHKRINDEIGNIEQVLEIDFGPNEEFFTLKGQCFEITDREYTYSLCPFDRTSQRPKDAGSETSLGRWGRWVGPEESKYSKMKYEDGVTCWNGPARSVVVNLQCGVQNILISASEPSRCEYLFEFTTPAICFTPVSQMDEHVHTEL
ncbi:glucosidase 2 subunit beta-like isoform X2 [Tachypleus tridentatus]|uniref:glucosidase 2 subunit beta-like isoform X2 n=1 Tax=Tachypleus tridentatus TaxID=6853 RepID=UPI003FD63D7D